MTLFGFVGLEGLILASMVAITLYFRHRRVPAWRPMAVLSGVFAALGVYIAFTRWP